MLPAEQTLQREETFRIREYLVVLKLRKWSIIAITLLAVLAAIFFTREQTPVYTSTISVVATDPLAQIYSGTSRGPNMSVETSLVKSLPVTQCTAQILKNPSLNTLGSDLSKICDPATLAKVTPDPELLENVEVALPVGTTGAPTQEALFNISYSDPAPATAQKTAQAFALAYKNYKVTQATASLTQLTDPLQTQLDEVNHDLKQVNKDIDNLFNQISGASQGDQVRLNAQLRTKEDEQSQLNAQAAGLQQQLAQYSPLRINPPDIPAPAILPVKPSSPKLVINVALALIVGLAFGIGLAFLREKLDDRLRGRADLEERLGTSVLAVVPQIPGWKRRHGARLASVDHPRGAAAEAYRTLRTSVMFAAAQRGMKVIMLTSPGAGEGKSTTAA
ncbi:MAG TPA: Wzz/FepE/Etk N-terminal domain-containing protein, partial [Actinomycetota bacterium]|nr:Wzz/FepE/Etk N-terminal domain-containing protein [Actinomycetota bacterium]